MSKHLTPQETSGIAVMAAQQLHEVEHEDGPRNAALFAPIHETATRFHYAPHIPESTLNAVSASCEQLGKASRVADAYRATTAHPLTKLASSPMEAPVVEAAHNAVAQYAAAARQHAEALEGLQVDLFEHLRAVTEQ